MYQPRLQGVLCFLDSQSLLQPVPQEAWETFQALHSGPETGGHASRHWDLCDDPLPASGVRRACLLLQPLQRRRRHGSHEGLRTAMASSQQACCFFFGKHGLSIQTKCFACRPKKHRRCRARSSGNRKQTQKHPHRCSCLAREWVRCLLRKQRQPWRGPRAVEGRNQDPKPETLNPKP